MQVKRIDEIGVFGYDDVLLTEGKLVDGCVGRAITERQVESMGCFMAGLPQSGREAARKLSINEELHADTGSSRLIWLNRVANASAARMSSRSRSS